MKKNNCQNVSKNRKISEILGVYSTLFSYYLNYSLLKLKKNISLSSHFILPFFIFSYIVHRSFPRDINGLEYFTFNFHLYIFLNYVLLACFLNIHNFIIIKGENDEDFELTEKQFLSYIPNIKRTDIVIIEKFYKFFLAFIFYVLIITYLIFFSYFFLKINIFHYPCKFTLISNLLIYPFFSYILVFIPISSFIPNLIIQFLLFPFSLIPFSTYQYKIFAKILGNFYLKLIFFSQIFLFIITFLSIKKDINKKEKNEY